MIDAGHRPVRLAVLGCGAVTELCHLPGAWRCQAVEIRALVDRDLRRAQALAPRVGAPRLAGDYREVLDEVDGVINALPHHLHAAVTIECLARGRPVLVEKPMARSLAEAEAMVRASEAHGVPVQVALMNRFCDGARIIKRAVDEGWLGRLEQIDVEWGFVYDWPVASGFFFDREQAGGGVLLDLGSHVVDLVLWWLGGAVLTLDYRDDSRGGVEAECQLSATVGRQSEAVPVSVTLSRLRALRNTARLVGDRFSIECDISSPVSARMWPTAPGGTRAFTMHSESDRPQTLEDAYAAQLAAFARTIAAGAPPAVPGAEVLASMAVLDRCYRERQDLTWPWEC